jgi:hypothetical protein
MNKTREASFENKELRLSRYIFTSFSLPRRIDRHLGPSGPRKLFDRYSVLLLSRYIRVFIVHPRTSARRALSMS